MTTGSFYPGHGAACLHAMAADDCSLHFELGQLTPKQQADHQANIELTGMLQLALVLLGQPQDHLALYEEFRQPPWHALLGRQLECFEALGVPLIARENFHFHPSANLYDSLASKRPHAPRLNLYMISGSNSVLHRDPDALEVSRKLNSKFHFAQHAPAFGLPVPATMTCTREELRTPRVRDFFASHPGGVMLKIQGLAGARNVTAVDSPQAGIDYLEEFDDDLPVLLQERLSLESYTEMTADLRIERERVSIANVRKILFAEGLWVGNRLGPDVALTMDQQATLLEVGRYVQHHGYTAHDPVNCGVDFFLSEAGDVLVTEINARWTGGLFPSEALGKLDLLDEPATVLFDIVPVEQRDAWMDFEQNYLLQGNNAFRTLPLGFSPFVTPMNGTDMFFVWQLVTGDYDAFLRYKQHELQPGVLPTADLIDQAM